MFMRRFRQPAFTIGFLSVLVALIFVATPAYILANNPLTTIQQQKSMEVVDGDSLYCDEIKNLESSCLSDDGYLQAAAFEKFSFPPMSLPGSSHKTLHFRSPNVWRFFPTASNSLRHQLGVLQFNSNLILPTWG